MNDYAKRIMIFANMGLPHDVMILFNFIYYWVKINTRERKNYHNHRYWLKNVLKKYGEKNVFINKKITKNNLAKLITDDWVTMDVYKGERWYTISHKSLRFLYKWHENNK